VKTKILTSQTNPKPRWCQDNELTKDFQAFVRSDRIIDAIVVIVSETKLSADRALSSMLLNASLSSAVASCPELSPVTKTC